MSVRNRTFVGEFSDTMQPVDVCSTAAPPGFFPIKSPSTSAQDGSFLPVPSVVRCDPSPPRHPMFTNNQAAGNQLLARLAPAEFKRLTARMRPVTLDFRQVLYRAKAPIESVYFPNRGTASALTIMDDGSAIEVATVGKEGVVGLGVLLADKTSANEVIIQIAGDALQMDADVLEQEARKDSPLRRLLLLYQTAFLTQVSQSVACNGLHAIQQRCCRWLLMTHDRVDTDEVPLTHEFLGIMLGVRRASVTEILGPLNEQGLVSNGRGTIRILNRAGLEKLACECYRKVRDEFDRILGDGRV
jgi:CRP-like cAMP-binding protein